MERTDRKVVGHFFYYIIHVVKTVFQMPHGSCRYIPSCSEYARVAISRFPLYRAAYLIFIRITKCHPFSKGGFDPLPENRNQA